MDTVEQSSGRQKAAKRRDSSAAERNPEAFLRARELTVDSELLRTIEYVRRISAEVHAPANQEEILLTATSHA